MENSITTIKNEIAKMAALPTDEKVDFINEVRAALHEISPFNGEPVDFVRWVKNTLIYANDYNPNSVAPPEMELLRLSIASDGYTQPIVSMSDDDGKYEVIDGFHRHRVGKECDDVRERILGYLPVVQIRESVSDKTNRMASTIRHNRARGKHGVEAMAEIVVELKRRNWSNERVAKELGMDSDEVLRLCQITGLREAFADQGFSQGWDAIIVSESDMHILDESDIESISLDDEDRIMHEWSDWECFPAGFYSDKPPQGMTVDQAEDAYRAFLADIDRFDSALDRLIVEWKNSCEHYLTNKRMNRIAWLGQAAMCIDSGISSWFCGGYNLLDDQQKVAADEKALQYLNKWLVRNGRPELTMEECQQKTQVNLY